jgi:hypothetical protein
MTEKERNLLYGVVSLILPENILDQFDIVRLEDEDIATLNQQDAGFINFGDPQFVKYLIENYG